MQIPRLIVLSFLPPNVKWLTALHLLIYIDVSTKKDIWFGYHPDYISFFDLEY